MASVKEELSELKLWLALHVKNRGIKDAFRDEEIGILAGKINRRIRLIVSTVKCPKCYGRGGEMHICDCEFCEIETIACEYCGGSGRVSRD